MKKATKAVALTLALGTLGTTALSTATTAEAASVKWGSYQKYGKYETVMKKGYGIFQDKKFKKKVSTTDKNYQKTYLAKGYYKLSNGQKYVSLYNKDNKWVGYVNEKAMKVAKNKGGVALTTNKTVSIKKNNYTLWKDLDFKAKKGTTKSIYKKNVYVKPHYNHFNGSVYYSLYNSQDKWLGYVNKDATGAAIKTPSTSNGSSSNQSQGLNASQVNKDFQNSLTNDYDWEGTWHSSKDGYDKAVSDWENNWDATTTNGYYVKGYATYQGTSKDSAYIGKQLAGSVDANQNNNYQSYKNGYSKTTVNGDKVRTDFYFWN